MAEYTLKLDARRCIGCHACESHCQIQNQLPSGMSLGRILVRPERTPLGGPDLLSAFVTCLHCDQPWCLPACPTGAIRKDPESGLVLVEDSLCVGCLACVEVCPWSAPKWDDTRAKVVKCDYCQERCQQGLEPACVAACTTRALTYQPAGEASRWARIKYAGQVVTSLARGQQFADNYNQTPEGGRPLTRPSASGAAG